MSDVGNTLDRLDQRVNGLDERFGRLGVLLRLLNSGVDLIIAVPQDVTGFRIEDGTVRGVEAAAWDAIANEARIRIDAARGRDVGAILADHGAF